MPESPSLAKRYGPPSRGVTRGEVEIAADALLREGRRPTVEKVRAHLGRGSPNTINPMLDAWWKRLTSRLDAGPAALHRLPEGVAQVAEALWMQALEEARRRAALEQNTSAGALVRDQQTLAIRSHVLSLREGELESRLRDRERAQAAVDSQLRELGLLLRKEQATRASQARRIAVLEAELAARWMPHAARIAPARQAARRTKIVRSMRKSRAAAKPPRPRPAPRTKPAPKRRPR